MKSRCITRNRAIPFSLDRGSKVSLTRQVEAGFKRAILTGWYKAGDVLPPRDVLATMLGVSEIVSREAMRRLVAEGYVCARPRIGSVVLARDVPHWRGRVLLVGANGDGGYYQSSLGQRLRTRLFAAGYLVADAAVLRKDGGEYDAAGLDPFLKETIDMAVIVTPFTEVMRQLANERVPFVSIGRIGLKPEPQCLAEFWVDYDSARDEMERFCRDVGVKSVLEIWTWDRCSHSRRRFVRAGMAFEDWRISAFRPENGYIEAVQRGALMAFEERLAKEGTAWLPDLLYFRDDDHLAAGALSALLHHGVDVPRDVRVVTLANRGLGPVFHRPLARLEVDPVVHANVIADYVLARLGGAVDLPVPSLPVNFIPGETLRI